jgi:hypothetical protein
VNAQGDGEQQHVSDLPCAQFGVERFGHLKVFCYVCRTTQEKQDLERQWADKQRAADRAAAEAQAALRGELETRLAAVTVRVEAVAQKEFKQGRKRGTQSTFCSGQLVQDCRRAKEDSCY